MFAPDGKGNEEEPIDIIVSIYCGSGGIDHPDPVAGGIVTVLHPGGIAVKRATLRGANI